MSYLSFSVLTLVNSQEGVDVVHGGWLIAIVGTESVVLLGTMLAPGFGDLAAPAYVAVHALWGIGIALYGIFITLFSYRIFFLRVTPADMTPLFWVIMGAAAIATNAGSTLILSQPDLPFLLALKPFVNGATLILWAWSSWWIPLLVVFAVWKHGVCREPIAYSPMYWSLVFPLGMYAVATYRLSLAADYRPLQAIAQTMVWVAFAAWALTLTGLLRRLGRAVFSPVSGSQVGVAGPGDRNP